MITYLNDDPEMENEEVEYGPDGELRPVEVVPAPEWWADFPNEEGAEGDGPITQEERDAFRSHFGYDLSPEEDVAAVVAIAETMRYRSSLERQKC
jgi:hypothetical protein